VAAGTASSALASNSVWQTADGPLSLERPLVMGILNLTPDSFSDGGELISPAAAVERGIRMVEEGADLLDVGGESTRPGAPPIAAAEQLDRVLTVVQALAERAGAPVSVDTRSAEVARPALRVGASIINDVSALGDPEMADVVRAHGAGLVLMHMRGTPETMREHARYGNVAREVAAELGERLAAAELAGIDVARIVVDPGIGFAKDAAQNVALIADLQPLLALGRPVLVGPSRKSFIGQILEGAPPRDRDAGTVGACVAALMRGARIFRVHQIAAVRQALDVAEAVRQALPAPR
jgi:dihydropteroate synthase